MPARTFKLSAIVVADHQSIYAICTVTSKTTHDELVLALEFEFDPVCRALTSLVGGVAVLGENAFEPCRNGRFAHSQFVRPPQVSEDLHTVHVMLSGRIARCIPQQPAPVAVKYRGETKEPESEQERFGMSSRWVAEQSQSRIAAILGCAESKTTGGASTDPYALDHEVGSRHYDELGRLSGAAFT
jgi:hypothetical protein